MIHLISSENRHLYGPELEEFYRERHRQFVIERGWPLRCNCSRLLTGLLRVGADGMVDGGLAA